VPSADTFGGTALGKNLLPGDLDLADHQQAEVADQRGAELSIGQARPVDVDPECLATKAAPLAKVISKSSSARYCPASSTRRAPVRPRAR
jgi:hypothetical protein